MNFNQFTTKAQEAVQMAQQLAMQNGQQAIETGHLLRGLLDTDEYVLPHLFRKLSVNTKALDA
ncbi:MAG: Clp protease N-terminal domain-containing protein, partial [Bacteroidia bacterium]